MARWVVKSALALLALPLVAFAAYDVLAYQSRHAEIAALLSRATAQEQALPPALAHLTELSRGRDPAAQAARLLLRELRVPQVARGMLGSHATDLLWWACVSLHLSRQEQLAIFASRSYMGGGRYGYSAEATSRFSRPLAALSIEESATLVLLARNPTAYEHAAQRLERSRVVLLAGVAGD